MELDSAQNHPTEEKYTLELNPMVTAGIAHKSDYHVITAEVDLTKKEAFGYEDDTQWLALGAEFDAWRYAQLRAGVRHNLASNDDNDGIEEDTQFTAGLGLNIIGVRVDIGALYSSADVGAAWNSAPPSKPTPPPAAKARSALRSPGFLISRCLFASGRSWPDNRGYR